MSKSREKDLEVMVARIDERVKTLFVNEIPNIKKSVSAIKYSYDNCPAKKDGCSFLKTHIAEDRARKNLRKKDLAWASVILGLLSVIVAYITARMMV